MTAPLGVRRFLAAPLHAVALAAYALGALAFIGLTPLFLLAQGAWALADVVAADRHSRRDSQSRRDRRSRRDELIRSTSKEG